MATKVVMEALSPTMEEGRLVSWRVREGDPVAAGDTLAEVETDKAIMELVARGEGVLRRIVVAEGTMVPVGTLVAVVGAPDEDVAALVGERPAPPPVPPGSGAPGRVASSPLARRLAAEAGVDVRLIRGSGPSGRVIKRDVVAAGGAMPLVAPGQAAGPALPAPQAAAAGPAGPVTRDEPLTMIRRTIAARLAQSLGPVPHFFLTVEMDMERAWEARESLKALGPEYRVSLNDLIIKAVALALRRHPAVNASFLDEVIRYHGDVHIGMAVAVEGGLITPVVRFADRKGLAEIARETAELAERARARKLQSEEYTGATFTVSNLGRYEIDEFTAVINPPEGGVLAVGRVAQKPAVVDGAVVARHLMRATMSCDHRVIDGATGASFLQSVKTMLENPMAMLL